MPLALLDILGYAGAGFALGSYAARSHRALCSAVAVGMALMAAHFWLLEAHTSAWLCLLSAGRSFVAPDIVRLPARTRWLATLAVLAGVAGLSIASWQAWHSSLMMMGTGLLVLFSFQLKDRAFRLALLLVELFFAANALAVGSMPALLLALAGLLLNVIVLMRTRTAVATA